MKTISFPILVLIASPSFLFGQDFNEGESSYYAEPDSINAPANHLKYESFDKKISSTQLSDELTAPRVAPIFEPSTRISMQRLKPQADSQRLPQPTESTRFNGPSTRVKFSQRTPTPLESKPTPAKIVALKIADAEVPENKKALRATVGSNDLPSAKIAVTEHSIFGGDFKQKKSEDLVSVGPYVADESANFETLKMATSMQPIEPATERWQDIEIVAPPAARQIMDEIERPIPESGNDLQPTEIINEAPTAPQPIAPPRSETITTPAPQAQPAPADSLDVFQRVVPQRPVSTMRHVTDHFSPGGEPFAIQNHYRDTSVGGLDRSLSCDEWRGFGRCGGLKSNPGHLGLPWLGSGEPCDQVTPCPLGRRRCRNSSGSCDCQQCNQCSQ